MKVTYQEMPGDPYHTQEDFRRFLAELDGVPNEVDGEHCFINVAVRLNPLSCYTFTGSAAFTSSDGVTLHDICALDGFISSRPLPQEGTKRYCCGHAEFCVREEDGGGPLTGLLYSMEGLLVDGETGSLDMRGEAGVTRDVGPMPEPENLPDRSVHALLAMFTAMSFIVAPF